MTRLEQLAQAAADAKAALNAAVVAERAAGRTFADIAAEAGLTPAGVAYICGRADGARRVRG